MIPGESIGMRGTSSPYKELSAHTGFNEEMGRSAGTAPAVPRE